MASGNKLTEQFSELDSMPKGLSGEDARRRGANFEKLVLDLFEQHGMLLRRPYHTSDGKSEQIDGAIRVDGRIALVESKWVKSQLAASELFAFSGKVDGKFVGTIGVFVSRNPLSDNFLTALRTGRRQAVLVIHGPDIDAIFEESFPLSEYLKASLEVSSVDNVCHYPASEFLKDLSLQNKPPISKGIPADVEAELRQSDFEFVVDEVAKKIQDNQLNDIYKSIVTVYKNQAKDKKLDQFYGNNLISLALELKPRLPNKRLDADWLLFDAVSRNFIDSLLRPFIKYFADRLTLLSKDEKETVFKRLLAQWNKILGSYENENEMAEITKPIYDYLNDNTKVELLSIFITFVTSSRYPRYPQVRLAEECVRNAKSVDIEKAIVTLLRRNIESWLEDEDLDDFTEKDRKRLISWQCQEYSKLSNLTTQKIKLNTIVEGLVDEVLLELRSSKKKK